MAVKHLPGNIMTGTYSERTALDATARAKLLDQHIWFETDTNDMYQFADSGDTWSVITGNLITETLGGKTLTSPAINTGMSSANALTWTLFDNNASGLTFDTAGKTGMLKFDTRDSAEKVTMSAPVDLASTLNVTGNTTLNSGILDVKNAGTASVVRLYCESSNAHYAELKSAAHSAYSGNVTLTLPVAAGTLVGTGNLTAIVATGDLDAGSITSGFGNIDIGSNSITCGDLTVNGTTTTVNSATLTVDDKNLEIGSVATPSDTTANGGGITLRGATDKTIIWDSTNTNWTSNQHWNLASTKSYKINNVAVLTATGIHSNVKVGLDSLEIDGYSTELNEDIVDGDLFIIDNGANGTNRKVLASRIKTYAAGSGASESFAIAMAVAL